MDARDLMLPGAGVEVSQKVDRETWRQLERLQNYYESHN